MKLFVATIAVGLTAAIPLATERLDSQREPSHLGLESRQSIDTSTHQLVRRAPGEPSTTSRSAGSSGLHFTTGNTGAPSATTAYGPQTGGFQPREITQEVKDFLRTVVKEELEKWKAGGGEIPTINANTRRLVRRSPIGSLETAHPPGPSDGQHSTMGNKDAPLTTTAEGAQAGSSEPAKNTQISKAELLEFVKEVLWRTGGEPLSADEGAKPPEGNRVGSPSKELQDLEMKRFMVRALMKMMTQYGRAQLVGEYGNDPQRSNKPWLDRGLKQMEREAERRDLAKEYRNVLSGNGDEWIERTLSRFSTRVGMVMLVRELINAKYRSDRGENVAEELAGQALERAQQIQWPES